MPVTVRQLEAIIRISEALAKMALQVGAFLAPSCPMSMPAQKMQRTCAQD